MSLVEHTSLYLKFVLYIVTLPYMGFVGIFAPVHKITKATSTAGQSGTLPKRASLRLSDAAGKKRDSPTNTLERKKAATATVTDVEVILVACSE